MSTHELQPSQRQEAIVQKIDEIRERFLAAVHASDVRGVLACYTADAVLVAPEGRYEGSDYIEAYYRQQFSAFSDLRLKLHAVHDVGDTGIAEWSFSGVNTGTLELPDGTVLPATGRRTTQRGADVAIIRDGRIGEHRLYYDQLELIAQLGVQPPVPA
jgi:ketosteroid isomerase-like protein